MDDFVCTTLTEWGLSELIEKFKDEEIDLESLLCLDDQEIAKLIPKTGPRSKFKDKLKSLRVLPSTSDTTDNENLSGKRKMAAQCESSKSESPAKRRRDAGLGSYSEHKILSDVRKIMTDVHNGICQKDNTRLNAFLRDKIEVLEKDKRELIGVFGKTGAGKSTLINAIIGEENLLPSASGSACTSAMIKVEADMKNQKYEAEIDFITKEDWREELWTFDKFFKDISDLKNRDDGDDDDVYREKLSALYGEGWKDKSPDELMDKKYFKEIPEFLRSEKKMLTCKSAAELSEILIKYTRIEEDERCYWPLVKCVTVKVPNKKLLQHVTLIDLPGNGDCNKARDGMWKELIARCSTVWIVTEMNRAASEIEAWEILESVCGLMGNGGQCQQIHFICTKSDEIGVLKPCSTDEIRVIRKNKNEKAKKRVQRNFNKKRAIQKHFEQDRLTVFIVSSKQFLLRTQQEEQQDDDNEIPKLQEFLRELNVCHSENLAYVSGAYGILSLIEGARSGQVTGRNGEVCTDLEESMKHQFDQIRKPIEDAYEAFEKCLSEGVKKSEDSCKNTLHTLYPRGKKAGSAFHKTLKCVVVNNGVHKTVKKKQINLNAMLASSLTDCIDEEFKKTFPNGKRCDPFNGVISEFSLHTEKLIKKYEDLKLQLTFLKTEENKIKTELHNIIRDKKKTIYSSLTESIKNSMQQCYDTAAQFKGEGSLNKMKQTIENHVRDSKNTMFETAKAVMLTQLNELKDTILKKLEETMQKSIKLSLSSVDGTLPDVTEELKMVNKYNTYLMASIVETSLMR
ncbi:nuclear GTPase SLIP-GC-like [Scomber scombrus]|uniref:Nuclear GTPase SLIP-GC-like n=1 Tax=Scomber scombrus TaxID=13677 RepID=A0AAV1P042_SCOSC